MTVTPPLTITANERMLEHLTRKCVECRRREFELIERRQRHEQLIWRNPFGSVSK